jgi:maltooligosyltrehalose trehalohydrolase
MNTFSVWAPAAETVQLMLGDERRPMVPGPGGWWVLAADDAGPGTDYAFAISGGPPLPDPRSPCQPDGPHGRSRVVDHAAFAWTDQAWTGPVPLAAAVFYELHVGTFTPEGTFESAIERLRHLVDLGVTHIELMPVCEFPGARGWGYDGVDLFAPHHAYGGPDGLKRLVDAAHGHGLGVVLDVVYNHLGPDGNYLASYGPYFTDRYTTPWGEAVNFDGRGSDEVRRFVLDNASMWLADYHIDGLRLDAVHAIYDFSALHILEELGARVRALESSLGRRLLVIPESDLNDPRLVRSTDAGGYGLDAAWNDDFHHALHAALTGEQAGYYEDFGSLADLADALERVYVYDGRHSAHRGRRHGRPAAGVPGHRFLGFLQNHDQIGNRAQGERSCHLVSLGKLKIGAALVGCAPFVPMFFAGEEWAASSPFCYFTDHQDPELGRAVSEGRRREFASFGWDPAQVPDPQAPATFERSRLDWAELDKEPHAEMLAWHRQVLALRRRLPDLTGGDLSRVRTIIEEEERWLVLNRGAATVAANLSAERRFVPLPPEPGVILLSSTNYVRLAGEGRLDLPPESVAILGPLE